MVEGLEHLQGRLEEMNEWAKSVIFDQDARVIACKGLDPDAAELQPFLTALDSRDHTIGTGFTLAGNHFDVHRFHPPLVYGRRGGPEEGEGIAYARALKSDVPIHAVITYELPILSARAVPQLIEFLRKYVGVIEIPPPN